MRLFRSAGEPHVLAIAMTGIRMGDRLLLVGCGDPTLLGALCSKVGLSGRACVVVTGDAMAARAERGAQRAGIFVEIGRPEGAVLPFEDAAFNLVVVDGAAMAESDRARETQFKETWRVLSPRGRIVVIDPSGVGRGLPGLFRRSDGKAGTAAPETAFPTLNRSGFRAVRSLGERAGLVFTEGIK